MNPPRPIRLISRDTHTTALPDPVYREALDLLAGGTIAQRQRAAQILASAYAEDEERRLSGTE